MAGDVNRLFSMINQINLPYQVFEDSEAEFEIELPVRPSEGEAMVLALQGFFGCPPAAANEDVLSGEIGFLQAYAAPAPVVEAAPVAPTQQAAGQRLSDIFQNMRAKA